MAVAGDTGGPGAGDGRLKVVSDSLAIDRGALSTIGVASELRGTGAGDEGRLEGRKREEGLRAFIVRSGIRVSEMVCERKYRESATGEWFVLDALCERFFPETDSLVQND